MECDVLHFFELGSCHYDYYLMNIRLPIDGGKNLNIGKITDLELVVSNFISYQFYTNVLRENNFTIYVY